MTLKLAFAGFRHGHIEVLYAAAAEREDIEITALCEEDPDSAAALSDRYNFTHTSISEMLEHADCDAVAVGDYYAKRGGIIIEALRRGKHVISDKPICTDPGELDQIEKLLSEKSGVLGCMLDMRDSGLMITLKRLLEEGAIGEPITISFGGQHPLSYGKRPDWYFEEGKHGGTLNDIAIHGIDFVMWLTGSPVSDILSARCWNARLNEVPYFQDAAQCLLKLENGCGVLGDVSYLSPDSFGYSFPLYWRVTVHGSGGVMETRMDHIALWRGGEKEMEKIEPDASRTNGYLEDFIAEINGTSKKGYLNTQEILRSSKVTLLAQNAADKSGFGIKI